MVEHTRPWYKRGFHWARQELAKQWITLFPQTAVIAVTGSVGKTTAKEAIGMVLSQKYQVVKSEANLDPVFNIPITLLKVRPSTQQVILEMGIVYPGEMTFYMSLVRPKIGVVTKIDWTHTEFLKDADTVQKEKGQLISSLPKWGHAVLNWDDSRVRSLAKSSNAPVFFYGSDPESCQLWYDHVDPTLSRTKFTIHYKQESVEVHYPLLGRHQIVSAVAAASVGVLSKLNLLTIRRGLEQVTASPHRFQKIAGPNGSIIIDDTYNASPVATVAALTSLAEFTGERHIAILGHMRELGDYNEAGHRLVGKTLVDLGYDGLITYRKEAADIARYAQEYRVSKKAGTDPFAYAFDDVRKILVWMQEHLRGNDIVLIKGSRHTIHLERLVAGIMGRSMTVICPVCPQFAKATA